MSNIEKSISLGNKIIKFVQNNGKKLLVEIKDVVDDVLDFKTEINAKQLKAQDVAIRRISDLFKYINEKNVSVDGEKLSIHMNLPGFDESYIDMSFKSQSINTRLAKFIENTQVARQIFTPWEYIQRITLLRPKINIEGDGSSVLVNDDIELFNIRNCLTGDKFILTPTTLPAGAPYINTKQFYGKRILINSLVGGDSLPSGDFYNHIPEIQTLTADEQLKAISILTILDKSQLSEVLTFDHTVLLKLVRCEINHGGDIIYGLGHFETPNRISYFVKTDPTNPTKFAIVAHTEI